MGKKGIILNLSVAVSPRRELAVGFAELRIYIHVRVVGGNTASTWESELFPRNISNFKLPAKIWLVIFKEHIELLFLFIIKKVLIFNHMNNWLTACLCLSFILLYLREFLRKFLLLSCKRYSAVLFRVECIMSVCSRLLLGLTAVHIRTERLLLLLPENKCRCKSDNHKGVKRVD